MNLNTGKYFIVFSFLLVLITGTPLKIFSQASDSLRISKPGILKRTSLAVIPIIGFNRSYGVAAGVLLNAFTKLQPADNISPISRSTLGTGYTQNKSFVLVASQKLFLKKDKWRIFWALGLGKSNFQFFDESEETGGGVFVSYQTNVNFFSTNALYNIGGRFYTGLKYQYSKSTVKYEDGRPDVTTKLSGWGIPVTYDSRDFVYYPAKGIMANVLFSNNAKWLGSDVNFSSISAFTNHYTSLQNKGILASRFFTYVGLGDVPFVGQKVIGGKDLRGYTKGQYRSNTTMALQTEYRKSFSKKMGFVLFGGVAAAFKTEDIDGSGLLPAAGGGLRYLIIPKQKINIGIDVAAGKGDWGLYFRIGEAF